MDSLQRADFRIHGLDCAEEVSLLKRQLGPLPGIRDLGFDVVNGKMSAEFDPKDLTLDEIIRQVSTTGLRAEVWKAIEVDQKLPFWDEWGRWITTGASGAALLAAIFIEGITTDHLDHLLHPHHSHANPTPLPVVTLSLIAIAFGAAYWLPKALKSLRMIRPDMNVLVLISIFGACYLGEWSEGGTLSFLFSLAGLLEVWSMTRARNSIGALMKERPGEAAVLHGKGVEFKGHCCNHDASHMHEHKMPVENVLVGSTVRVRPGEKIPFDGEVATGTSGVDQALITGEATPVTKVPGDKVFAGTLNTDGVLEIRTSTPASDTTISRIIRMVEESQKHRAPSEQLVERFSRYYTPAMMLFALLVLLVPRMFFGWTWEQAFYQSMVVLLISCPCALVISTPVTIAAALASAARHGVLVKGGANLETAARLRAFAFDKTGVLTTGQAHVKQILPLNGYSRNDLLAMVAGVEEGSEHPLGQALVRHAASEGIRAERVSEFRALPGLGAEGRTTKGLAWVGGKRYLEERGISGASVDGMIRDLESKGMTVVFVGLDSELMGIAALRDELRGGFKNALDGLRDAGLEQVTMLTGDRQRAAQVVAGELGIDDVRADLLPIEKVVAVRELMEKHRVVAMAGDGVNDVQALTASALGIAVGRRATDVAMETADVVILSEDPRRLPFLVRHARRSLSVIKQNLAIALGSKVIFLAVAFLGLASLWMAVAADMGATLVVTFNGLRMLKARENG